MRDSKSRRPAGRPRAEGQRRETITFEAARIMAEEGVRDFQTAKRKALERLGLPENRFLPSNEEIQSALEDRLQLFHRSRSARELSRLRKIAFEAMRFLNPFDPRLVGPVLSGVVTPDTEVQLHLTADAPEEVGLHLREHAIPFVQTERRLRFGGNRNQVQPVFRFLAERTLVELCIFTPQAIREPPLSPVDGRPIKRANTKEVEAMVRE